MPYFHYKLYYKNIKNKINNNKIMEYIGTRVLNSKLIKVYCFKLCNLPI